MFRLLDLLAFLRRKCYHYHIGYYVFRSGTTSVLFVNTFRGYCSCLALPTGRRANWT